MSTGLAKPLQTDYIKPTSKVPDQQGFDDLDKRLKAISDKIIPVSPYLLKVPSDRPFHLTPLQLADLRRGTPFNVNEEALQYMSFLPDWDNGLIVAQGGWANEKGEMETTDATMMKDGYTRSITSTPKVGAKKISLSDYKKRTAGQSSANGTAPVQEGFAHKNDQTLKRRDYSFPLKPRSPPPVKDSGKAKNKLVVLNSVLRLRELTLTLVVPMLRGSPSPSPNQ